MDERRLHDGLSLLEEAAPGATPPQLPASRRRPLLWVPAALALVAGVSIGLWGAQALTREPPRNVAASSSASAPLAASQPGPAFLSWTRSHYPDKQAPSFLFVTDDRLIAAGTGAFSDDGGKTWSEPSKIGTQEDDQGLGRMAERAGRLVSLGSQAAGTSGADADQRGVIWTSDDRGETWLRAASGALDIIGDIAATDSDFVAIGSRADPYPSEVWRSQDGIGWQRVETPMFDKAMVSGLAWNGQALVAVGVVVTDETRTTYVPMAWSSHDGASWEAHALGSSGAVSAIAVDNGEFVAAGPLTDGTLSLWHSTDGTSWSSETYFDNWNRVTGLAAGPSGLVVAGESDLHATGAWNKKLPYQHSLLAFLPRNGEPTVEDDIPTWPQAVAALPDRFVATANDCPASADCFLSYSILIGTPVDVAPQTPQPSGIAAWTEPDNYSFDVLSECSERYLVGWYRVDVQNHRVTRVEGLDADSRARNVVAGDVMTIGQLLERASNARAAYSVAVGWARDGHPNSISISWGAHPRSEEECYSITRFAPGTPLAEASIRP